MKLTTPAKTFLVTVLLATAVGAALGIPGVRAEQPKWKANIPAVATEPGDWQKLLHEFEEKNMPAGALAAASRMLMFFTDIESKEAAYKAVLAAVDQGYPWSVLPVFQAGDLVPAGDYDFINSYNLYKAVLNRDKGLDKWAKNYFDGVDKPNFRKYLFLQAIEAYGRKDYATAQQKLGDLLSREYGPEQTAFVRKVARTLARSYFDQENYARAYDIYSTFLLKLNPTDPRDWLEAGWSLYYLKRYPEALGMLYNLESKAAERFVNLEKFTLRALIYRNQCAVTHAEQLVQSFQKDFGEIIAGLKHGKSLSQFPKLASIELTANNDLRQISDSLEWLDFEQDLIPKLSPKTQKLASYLYKTEIQMLGRKQKLYMSAARERAALKLIMMDENLRFLKFAVQRERYNPDVVFKRPDETTPAAQEAEADRFAFKVRWLQYGDYWRDERLNFEGAVPNRCYE